MENTDKISEYRNYIQSYSCLPTNMQYFPLHQGLQSTSGNWLVTQELTHAGRANC